MRFELPDSMIILGTCGGSKEACEVIREHGRHIRIAFINDMENIQRFHVGGEAFPVINDWNLDPIRTNPDDFRYFTVGMGDPKAKRKMAEKALAHGLAPAPPVVSPNNTIRPTVRLGRGITINPRCVIGDNVAIGDCAMLHSAAIGPDATIGRYATCAPHCTVGAGAHIGEGAYVCVRASVGAGVQIADWVVVGLNAAAFEDVATAGSIQVGNPCRELVKPPTGC